MKTLFNLFSSIIFMFIMVATAHAAPIQWNLSGVVFEDGGTASGLFTYGADTDTLSEIFVTTTLGTAFGGTTYTFELPISPSTDSITTLLHSISADLFGVSILQLAYANPLTNAGGTISLTGNIEGICFNSDCGIALPLRRIQSGSITTTAVPEPTTIALFGISLAGMGFARKKRKSV